MWEIFLFSIKPAAAVAAILVVALAGLFVRALLAARDDERFGRFQTPFCVVSVLNAMAVFTWAATVIELLPLRTRLPVTDYGAPIGGLLLLVCVPAGLLASRRLMRRTAIAVPPPVRKYFAFSTLFLLVSLYPGIQVIVFYSLLLASDR